MCVCGGREGERERREDRRGEGRRRGGRRKVEGAKCHSDCSPL